MNLNPVVADPRSDTTTVGDWHVMLPSREGQGVAVQAKYLGVQNGQKVYGLVTVAGAAASGAPVAAALPANAATESTLAQLAADTAAIRTRQYDRFEHIELAPGSSILLPAGTYHSASFTVAPTNRNTPDFDQHAKVQVNGNGYAYYVNESATFEATELAAVDLEISANTGRVIVNWRF